MQRPKRYRYANNDMAELEAQLRQADADGARFKLIATDGVFSMDGVIADLKSICDLADKYDALVMVDDSHAVGFIGENGRGTHEYCGVMDRVDIITGTLGRSPGRRFRRLYLRQEGGDRLAASALPPYLFSNSPGPSIVSATIRVIDMLADGHALRAQLKENSDCFRTRMSAAGFTPLAGADHAIIPVMLGMPSWPPRWRAACWRLASTWWASPSPWSPRARPASAPDVRRPHPGAAGQGDRCLHPHRPRTRCDLIARLTD